MPMPLSATNSVTKPALSVPVGFSDDDAAGCGCELYSQAIGRTMVGQQLP